MNGNKYCNDWRQIALEYLKFWLWLDVAGTLDLLLDDRCSYSLSFLILNSRAAVRRNTQRGGRCLKDHQTSASYASRSPV